jgi:hypothetical protein
LPPLITHELSLLQAKIKKLSKHEGIKIFVCLTSSCPAPR